MRQYEVLTAKELFHGSDVIRGFGYKAAGVWDNYALFEITDCSVCCSPHDIKFRCMAI